MTKILNYIAKGKGTGAVWLLLLAFVYTLYLSLAARAFMFDSVPYVQHVADELLPVSVKDGKIVSPENTVREITLTGNTQNDTYSFVLDTTQDTLDTTKLTNGIYFSRLYAYTVNDDQIKTTKISSSFDLPKKDYQPILNSAIKWVVMGIAVVGIVVLFLIYFVLAIFYAYCAALAANLNKISLSFDTRMRLSSVAFSVVYILTFVLNMLGLHINIFLFFIIMLLVQFVVVKKLPQ